jgi:tyrosine-protein kinase Etk/Wzc
LKTLIAQKFDGVQEGDRVVAGASAIGMRTADVENSTLTGASQITVSEPAQAQDDEISLLDLLIALAKRQGLILKTAVVFALLAGVISFLLPKKYTALTTILPPQQSGSLSSALFSQMGSLGSLASMAGGGLGLKNPNDQYVSMIESRTVEDAMVKRFNLIVRYKAKFPSDARKAFEAHRDVKAGTKDGLINISIVEKDPKFAAEMANAYVEEFQKFSSTMAITEASQRRLFFQQQLEQAKDKLADAEEDLKRTEQKTGLIQLDSQARALIESAATLRAQVAAKEVQIQGMRSFATDQNAELHVAEQELAGLQAQLAKLSGSENPNAQEIVVPKGQVTEAGLAYIRKYRDVKYYETIFEILARQLELAKLDEAKQGALIQVVDCAVPPDRRSSPKRGLIVIGATALGLFLGVVFALILEGLKNAQPEDQEKLKVFFGLLRNRRTA